MGRSTLFAACGFAVALGCTPPPQPMAVAVPPPPIDAAAPPIDAAPTPPLEVARQVAATERVRFDRDWVQFIGHAGFVAPVVATSDGGSLLVGDSHRPTEDDDAQPLAIKVDARGSVTWTADLRRKGYAAYEAAGGVELPTGGFLAVIASYPNPARNPVTRFIKLDVDGHVVWDVVTRGDGTSKTPYPVRAEVTAAGALTIAGWLYTKKPAHTGIPPRFAWNGELSPDGAFTVDVTAKTPLPNDDRSHLVFAVDPSWAP